MFRAVRLKLTGWYLLMIMTLTLSFSAIVYASVNDFTTKALDTQRRRLERQFRDLDIVVLDQRPSPIFSQEVANEIKERTLAMLAIINFSILGITGCIGYLLAGKTLNPIESMMEKQKRFISDAAHEIKTPLTVMKANLEVSIRDQNLSITDAKGIMKETIDEVDNLHELSNQLLMQTKYLVNGSKDNNKTIFDIGDPLKAIIANYQNLAKKNYSTITLEYENPVSIKANRSSFEILIRNLLDNAIKYGKPYNSINIIVFKKDKNVSISIQDKGVGIPEEDIPHIFESFYKADKSRTKVEKEGAGLGLSICKEIVKSMKGEIFVRSTLGEGTTFMVLIPVSDNSQV